MNWEEMSKEDIIAYAERLIEANNNLNKDYEVLAAENLLMKEALKKHD